MGVLVRALAYGGQYDQLNLSSLMMAEILCRRASQIIEAYDSDPARPNWAGVRYMMGETTSLNPVPQHARALNAR